jgi:hypothetical protein
MARLLLLDRYLRERRIGEATVEMAALSRLIPGAGTLLTQEVAHLVADPATAGQTMAVLRLRPELQNSVLEDLARSGADPNLILRVAGPSLRPGSNQPWQEPLLSRLVTQGRIEQALRLWKTFAGISGDDQVKGLYDSGFRGLPGPPPFNWGLSPGGPGAAEPSKGGLQIDYYGRDDGELASQLLILAPGRYRFGFRAEGDASGEGSRLVWSLTCHPGGAQIMQLPLSGIASAVRRFSATIVVPAGNCPAQWLRLRGVSGDVATAQTVIMTGLSIDRESGS